MAENRNAEEVAVGDTVWYRGDVWWVHEILPHGSLVIRNHSGGSGTPRGDVG